MATMIISTTNDDDSVISSSSSSSSFIQNQQQQQQQHHQQSSSSSSISSLFERVTNFRRSLIQYRKKSRPPSSSFSLFNKSSSSSTITTNGVINETTLNINENDTPTINDNCNNNKCNMIIHVDEEDAIYGFTAINLNNPGKPRQLLTKQAITSSSLSSSSMSNNKMNTIVTDNNININNNNDKILNKESNHLLLSSSSTSLYETTTTTITENGPSLSDNNNNNDNIKQITKPHPSSKTFDWKNKRRSSVSTIFLFKNYQQQNNDKSQMMMVKNQPQPQSQSTTTTTTTSTTSTRRSSDDILMMSSSSYLQSSLSSYYHLQSTSSSSSSSLSSSYYCLKNSNNSNSNRIYENLQKTPKHLYKNIHHHHLITDPKRKLTKDSGYESSSSTLINYNHQCHSSGYGVLNRSSNQTSLIVDHSKSDSIDSNLSHKSFDSFINTPQISDLSEQSTRQDSKHHEPNSPPPTPPIRYSSLPQNNSTNDCWSYIDLYPKMRRKKMTNFNSNDPNNNQLNDDDEKLLQNHHHQQNCDNRKENLKEIQKRAVYQFYLRQKEKKKMNRLSINEITTKTAAADNKLKIDDDQLIRKNKSLESLPPPPMLPVTATIDKSTTMKNQSILLSLYQIFGGGLDLNKFWPSIDYLNELIPMLLVVFNNSGDLDDDQYDDQDDDQDDEILKIHEDHEINEELLYIDKNRRQKNRQISRINLLQMELNRIRKDSTILNETIALFIRNKLINLDSRNLLEKFNLLSMDLIRIIDLIFSIQKQIKSHNHNEQRIQQLNEQLNEAHNLSIAIQQRCDLFINRLSSCKRLFNDQWSTEQLLKMLINDNDNHVQQNDSNGDSINKIKIWFKYQQQQDQHQQQLNNMVNYNNDDNIDIWSFYKLIRLYLKLLQSFNVQRCIIESLIVYFQQQHH